MVICFFVIFFFKVEIFFSNFWIWYFNLRFLWVIIFVEVCVVFNFLFILLSFLFFEVRFVLSLECWNEIVFSFLFCIFILFWSDFICKSFFWRFFILCCRCFILVCECFVWDVFFLYMVSFVFNCFIIDLSLVFFFWRVWRIFYFVVVLLERVWVLFFNVYFCFCSCLWSLVNVIVWCCIFFFNFILWFFNLLICCVFFLSCFLSDCIFVI